MTAIEKLARAAIGVDEQRGDLLAVENLSFQSAPVETVAAPGKMEKWRLLMHPGPALCATRASPALSGHLRDRAAAGEETGRLRFPADSGAPDTGAAGGRGGSELGGLELEGGNNDTKHTQALKKELSEKIKTEPANASRLVQTWIHEQPKH